MITYDKTELNSFIQKLYDEKMREGKHGHYESMFHVVHKAIDRVLQAALAEPERETVCPQCKGLGYYDEGHENDDGSMAGGNYVDCDKCFAKFLKEGETPFDRFMRERKDGEALLKVYGRALTEIEELHKANMQLGLENGDLQDQIRAIQKGNPPIAYYDISHDEDGEVEYEFSVYPRKQFKPLFTRPAPSQPAPLPELTDENARRIWLTVLSETQGPLPIENFARAILAAAREKAK